MVDIPTGYVGLFIPYEQLLKRTQLRLHASMIREGQSTQDGKMGVRASIDSYTRRNYHICKGPELGLLVTMTAQLEETTPIVAAAFTDNKNNNVNLIGDGVEESWN